MQVWLAHKGSVALLKGTIPLGCVPHKSPQGESGREIALSRYKGKQKQKLRGKGPGHQRRRQTQKQQTT